MKTFKIDKDLQSKLDSQFDHLDESRVKEILEYCGGELNDLEELFQLYQSVLPENLQDISKAFKSKNSESLFSCIHAHVLTF